MPYLSAARQQRFQRDWYQKRRAEWLQANGPCRDCGSWDRLEVDHKDRGTKVSHRVWSWSKARRDAELAKCEPRCRDCHKQKTARELSKPIEHGTKSGYSHYGCRCDDCRAAATRYAREWRTGRAA